MELIEIKESDLESVSELMAQAFLPIDSGLKYICNCHKKKYFDRLKIYLLLANKRHFSVNQPILAVAQGKRIVATAAIHMPEYRSYLIKDLYFFSKLSALTKSMMGCRCYKYNNILNGYIPQGSYVYICRMAVHPDFQKKGCGKFLLKKISHISENHATSSGVLLETASEQNIEYYRRFGYDIISSAKIETVIETIMIKKNQP